MELCKVLKIFISNKFFEILVKIVYLYFTFQSISKILRKIPDIPSNS